MKRLPGKEWIRWWGLGVFVVIVGLWYLCIDWVIENGIEFAGTQAVGAKVELDSAELSLRKGTLSLDRLQVTNPDAPMQNLFESERIHFAIDVPALLRRQFLSDEASIDGLKFYTEREESGALDKRLFSFGGESKAKDKALDLVGKLNIPDVNQLARDEQARLQAEVEAMQGEVAQMKQAWQQRIDTMPGKDKLDGYKRRWEELEDQNALQRIKGVKELKGDIDDDLDTIQSLQDQIKADKARIAELTEQAKTLPGREADRLLAGVGLDEGFEGMIRHLIGDKAHTWLQRGLTLYQTGTAQLAKREAAAEPEKEKPARGIGEYIRFAQDQPQFLIKRASINGVAPIAGQVIDFDGELKDITTEQAIWGKPMTLLASGSSDSGASLKLDGLFDHRGAEALDRLNLDLKQLALKALSLSDNPRLPIKLQEGLANIATDFALEGGALDIDVDSLVRQAEFLVEESAEGKTAELLRKALTSASEFDIKMLVSGTPKDPSVRLSSSLDKLIGDALGAELKAKVDEKKAELKQKLAAQLEGPISELSGSGGFLEQYQDQLADRRAAFQALLKEMR